jgi:hypothetical protein
MHVGRNRRRLIERADSHKAQRRGATIFAP